jgi:DNA-binding response OmpR family regulator
MDISKMEAGEMRLQIIRSNLLNHIKPVFDSFRFLAERKSIDFTLHVNSESIIGYLDADKVEKIVYNLLSNAFKFTNPGGRIDVTVEAGLKSAYPSEAENVLISISDSGIGIPDEHVEHIFNRFYQVDSNITKGTGIGLSLTRDLVSLMKGSIKVESRHGKGTSFMIRLPLGRESFAEREFAEGSPAGEVDLLNMALLQRADYEDHLKSEETAMVDVKSKLPIILIVEDHYDMRKFLTDELAQEYQILEASDGARGIEMALEKIPDLIITDLILPFIDGFTLIDTLKKDKHTSHIPIILLTSKVNEESRTEGYETGADSYISKPFEMKVLKARVRNLLQVRKMLRQRFSSEISVDPKEIVSNSADEQLLNNAIEIIEQNSKDENFNVERLAEALGIHRVQLSRKFLALTNDNISDFIRITRLKKAAKLLVTRKFSISEVCYQVGFKDPAHFTRVFSRQFNITPRKFIAESQN